jgi:hypothetical protein
MVGVELREAGSSPGGCVSCSLSEGSGGTPSQEKQRRNGEEACAQHYYDPGDRQVLG